MDLTILGASGSYPSAESPCSGYLLSEDGYNVWMDAGNGTLVELQKHIAIRDVDAIILSHVHPDHCADIYPFFFAIMHPAPETPLPVFTPPGVRERLEALIGTESIERWRTFLDWRELTPGDVDETGPVRLEAFDAAHSVANTTLRIGAGGRTLCFSGDTGPNEHLARAARGADLFLCEASWSQDDVGVMEPIHLTAREAGTAAHEAGVDRLLLTHMWATNPRETMRAQAAETFTGSIELAIETGTVTV